MPYKFFPTIAHTGGKRKTMHSNINPEIIRLVANALDSSPEQLQKNAKLCVVLTELFETSPRSGRNQFSTLSARIALSELLVDTTRRMEVYRYINETPEAAEELLIQLIDSQKKLEDLISRCKNALESGNSQGAK